MAEETGMVQVLEELNRIAGRFDALEQHLEGRHQQIDIGFPSVVDSLDRLRGEIRGLRRWLLVLLLPIAASAVVAVCVVLRVFLLNAGGID